MFFPEKIKNIKPGDKVLEIGPGGTPYLRSDVLLEIKLDSEDLYAAQRGYAPSLETNKKIVYYDGKEFPFRDKEFDYVICSHVIEHVSDVELFISEMFRVAKAGYLEYPTIYYEYLYNFNVHENFIKWKNEVLFYLKKSETNLADFSPVHVLFYESLGKGYFSLVNDLKGFMFEGFEWDNKFNFKKASGIKDLCFDFFDIPKYKKSNLLRRIINKIKEL